MADLRDSPRQLIKTIAIVAVAVVIVWALYLARHALLLIYISVLLAIGFGPLIRFIERWQMGSRRRHRPPRWLAILLFYIVIVSVLLALALLVVPAIVQQAADFSARLPALVQQGEQWLIAHHLLTRHISLSELVAQAPSATDTVSTVASAVSSVIGGIVGLVTIIILTFYLLVESETLFGSVVRLFPRQDRRRVADASRRISGKVSAWLVGHLILAAVMGGAAAVGLFLMGVPFFYVVAVVAAVGELVPIVGPIVAGVTAVAVAATASLKLALVALVYFLVLHQIESNVLVPKVMERQVGVSPVTVLVALLIGGSLAGIIGAILAIPSAAILGVVMDELIDTDDVAPVGPPHVSGRT